MASTTKSTPSAKPKQPKKRAFVQASLTSRDTIDVRSHDVVYSLTREMVHSFFDLPSVDVARLLKVCVTVLKHIRSWAGIDCWPYRLVNNGVFELTREQIVGLRRSVIERLEGGEDAKYPGVLPLLREADVLGLAFKSISAPTEYAVEARAKALALKAARKADSDFKDRGAAATKVVSEVFKRPVAKRRVHWMSTGTVCSVSGRLGGERDSSNGCIANGAGVAISSHLSLRLCQGLLHLSVDGACLPASV